MSPINPAATLIECNRPALPILKCGQATARRYADIHIEWRFRILRILRAPLPGESVRMSWREIMNFGSWARGAFGPWRLQKHAARLAFWHREERNTEARAALSEPVAAPAQAIGPTQA